MKSLMCGSLALALLGAPVVGGEVWQKGSAAQKSCHDPCCSHCYREDRGTRGALGGGLGTTRSAPVGPVVESLPLMPAVPSMVSMPMLLGTRAAAVSRDVCDEDRVNELDARVEALHLRLMTIQRAVELQTQILEELRASGTIGGARVPVSAAPSAGP